MLTATTLVAASLECSTEVLRPISTQPCVSRSARVCTCHIGSVPGPGAVQRLMGCQRWPVQNQQLTGCGISGSRSEIPCCAFRRAQERSSTKRCLVWILSSPRLRLVVSVARIRVCWKYMCSLKPSWFGLAGDQSATTSGLRHVKCDFNCRNEGAAELSRWASHGRESCSYSSIRGIADTCSILTRFTLAVCRFYQPDLSSSSMLPFQTTGSTQAVWTSTWIGAPQPQTAARRTRARLMRKATPTTRQDDCLPDYR